MKEIIIIIILFGATQRILEALRRRYRYHRLPSLILVDSMSGRLITDIGRQCVLNDLEGNNFPWSQPSLSSILNNGGPLLYGTQSVDSQQKLEGKLTGLYFSSHDVSTYIQIELRFEQ